MDFLQFKKKIFLTRTYNFIFFETNVEIDNSLQVSVLKVSSIPIVCVIGSITQINALIEMLDSCNMKANIVDTINVNNDIDVLDSEHIVSTINQTSEVITDAKVCAGQFIKFERLEEMLSILASIYVPPPIRPMSIDIDFSIPVSIKSTVDTSKYVKVNVAEVSSVSTIVNSGVPKDIKSSVNYDLGLTIIMAKDTPIVIVGSVSCNVDIVSFIATANSEMVKASNQYEAKINANMGLVRYAKLIDYDNQTLADLGNRSLEAMSYIDII